ncbi:MAG: TIM barrel protein [Pseudohongiellaceae bacterium]
MEIIIRRRNLLKALCATPVVASRIHAQEEGLGPRQGRIKQSVMPQVWTGTDFTLPERCEILSLMGFAGMDLPQPGDIPVLQDFGLTPTLMTARSGTSFQNGIIRRELHQQIVDETHEGIDICVASGCKNLILFPGERRGMSREEGADNAAEVLARIAPYAEEKGVYVCMEITNSKVAADNRADQVFDDIYWGFDVCRRSGSPNITVVYDFYHVQIANGDVVRTMHDNLDMITHMHVAGVPSRREIDRTQELDYRWIAGQIADSGYEHFVAHEYRSTEGRNPLISLAVGYDILTV